MSQHDDHWDACPDGELHRMVEGMRAEGQRRSVNRAAVAGASVLLVITAFGLASLWIQGTQTSGQEPAPIACARVRQLLPAYAASSLSSELTERIAHHLGHCPACKKLRNDLQKHSAMSAHDTLFRKLDDRSLAVAGP